MLKNLSNTMPEIAISAAMIFIMLLLSMIFDLPILYPSGERAGFVGVHYIYPLMGVGLMEIVTLFVGKRAIAFRFLIALPCYAAVIFAYFNIKLWIPHINPASFDAIYWSTDQILRPIVELCIIIRRSVFFFIPYEANFYMTSYILLFYVSFLYHAIKTPKHFGKLIVAALLLQFFGTVIYLAAPAVGPFIYEAGINPMITEAQHNMLAFYSNSVANGPEFLVENGRANFTVGLAAMPSLHSASACLFFLFAWHHGKILVPLYAFVLIFILTTAVASRWHYVIDIPVGMAIAWASYRLAALLPQQFGINPDIDTPTTQAPLTA